MDNEKTVRSLAIEFIEEEFSGEHTYLGHEGAKSFIDKTKNELRRLYEPESKIYYLDEIILQLIEYKKLHNEKCSKGEQCYTYQQYEKAIFFVEQEIRSLPQIIKDNEIDNQQRNKVFISYSHEDADWLNNMKRHFKPIEDQVEFWDDSQIQPGQIWRDEISRAISSAKIAILLISADFFNSKFIAENELPPLLNAADDDGAVILNVFLKPCLVDEFPQIIKYQGINNPERTIIQMNEADKELVWMELVKQVKKILVE